MPAVAVAVAAVASYSAVTAAVAGTLTAMGALAAMGSVVGAVGSVTGNKSLAMVGMVMGAVGGIGALAQNAGLFGAEATAGEALFGVDQAASTAEAAGDFGVGFGDELIAPAEAALPGVTETGVATAGGWDEGGFIDAFGGATPEEIIPTTEISGITAEATGDAGSLINNTSGTPGQQLDLIEADIDKTLAAAQPTAEAPPVTGGGGEAVTGQPAPQDATASQVTGANTGTVTGQPAPVTGTPPDPAANLPMPPPPRPEGLGNEPGVFSKIMDFAKKNQLVTYGMMQVGGSFLQGMTDKVKPAQINALNAQADANRAAARLSDARATNMGARIPRATHMASQPQQGLINQGA